MVKKVLLCPVEIAGYMGRLKDGMIALEYNVKFLDLSDSIFSYNEKDDFHLASMFRFLQRRVKSINKTIAKAIIIPTRWLLKFYFFLYSLIWPDVIVFGFGKTILSGIELPIYKLLRKKLVFIYFGSDSRPWYLNGSVTTKQRGISIDECYRRSKKQRIRIDWLDRFADIIVDHVPSAQFHNKPFIPFLQIGMPAPNISIEDNYQKTEVIRILHAPSFPEAKGSSQIREAISELKSEGYKIEFIEIIDKPNSEVLDELKRCNFVVDELYSDSILAGLGTEAALFGKATIVGGYVNSNELGIRKELVPPAIQTHPDELKITIKNTIESGSYVDIGILAKEYISNNMSSIEVAKRFSKILEASDLSEVLYDPRDIVYYNGWGFPEQKLKIFLKSYLCKFGESALFLEHNPELKKRILKFVQN